MATQGFLSFVCWFAVHILHCRLLIKKRTEQISVLLYEWTQEKHNSRVFKKNIFKQLFFSMCWVTADCETKIYPAIGTTGALCISV